MGCGTNIVPGYKDFNKNAPNDKALEMKIEQELDVGQQAIKNLDPEPRANEPTFEVLPNYNPKNTVKSYKLFKFKNNKLYPLYVDARQSVPVGQWVQAVAGPKGKRNAGKVKSAIGELAYRPGWHAGTRPLATHIGGKVNPITGERMTGRSVKPTMREKDTVWAEVLMPADTDWQSEANRRAGVVKSGPRKGELNIKEAQISDQMPDFGYYKYKTNPNMDGSWLLSGQMKINRILTDREVRQINEQRGVSDLKRDYEMPFYRNSERVPKV